MNTEKIVTTKPIDPLQITYNVWRPTPSFAKKSPPHPDYELVVIDSSKDTSYLTLSQLHNLQQQLKAKEYEVTEKSSQETATC